MKPSPPNRPKSTHGNRGFAKTVENFSFGSGQSYGDRAEYADKKLVFDILAVELEPGRGFDGDRWIVTVKVAHRDCEVLSRGSNPGRDEETASGARAPRKRRHHHRRAPGPFGEWVPHGWPR